ncbi:hypothetical protein BX616_001683 [Lobosporangium transversale]|uniref:Arrestin C-terminal-like domain-containing protein n=1 Tax=Lobosporangium transversale TaxID=64571 RepID=A0A1Y2GED3_9FUNG|nr:hypothetical protein BCR41DRAFT_424481 [Lobosporangium transversale]KAF9903273.1 hypothetical protein BX616_001683 [Lobosporangium transversale]ORZ08516.1 hypothetical protein BCR41DRAFT_424481 [Lobosporangium transversale]|eukprot:XP_021878444.1 hypothetical protein BCR41DRAFT_424481 [Lobosporangium transversale]
MAASRVVYPATGQLQDIHLRSASPSMAPSAPTRIRTSGIFTRRLSLTAASVANTVASSSLFGSSPPPAHGSGFYQQSSFFRSSNSTVHINPAASSSSINVSSTGNYSNNSNNSGSSMYNNNNGSSATIAEGFSSRRQRTRSTSHPPPPKYKTSRTPQLRISLQDSTGNLVLSPPVMAPGESIRGQIHLELPKATPVHSIEVLLTGTVTALDGTRLGSMKTVTILEECKTVATASITNQRTNTTRRHTTPAPTTGTANSGTASASQDGHSHRGRARRSSMMGGTSQDRARFPAMPIQNTLAAAVTATLAAQGGPGAIECRSRLMSRTLSNPSPYYASGAAAQTVSTLSLHRSVSPSLANSRGRRTSFSANVDTTLAGFSVNGGGGSGGSGTSNTGGILGRSGFSMSMVNVSTTFHDHDAMMEDDPSLPAAPSYDPPDYENAVGSTGGERPSTDSSRTDTSSEQAITVTVDSSSERRTSEQIDDTVAAVSIANSAHSSDDVNMDRRHSSQNDQTDYATAPSTSSSSITTTTTTTSTTTTSSVTTASPPAEPVEPKAVLMQPGNYVIPFSIRIPANSVMSLPGSFSDPVGSVNYQLQAVMKQILPSPDPCNSKALLVEPTFFSATQAIKLIPMNDPMNMPLYSIPFGTEAVRANVGHWVWSTGFMEARAWVPKQGYRPGRIIPLVIHIVNHSDAKQVSVETTLCKCLHYGSGLSKVRAMGIAGQGYLLDSAFTQSDPIEPSEEIVSPIANNNGNIPEGGGEEEGGNVGSGRRRLGRRRAGSRSQYPENSMPSPPASPNSSTFPAEGDDACEGQDNSAQMARSISSQWESSHSNSGDSNGTPISSGTIVYSSENRSGMTSPTPSSHSTLTSSAQQQQQQQQQHQQQQAPLPIVQHLREKMVKSKTLVNCSLAVDREIQKTILVPIPHSAGYSILNAPLLEVSYEIVIKIKAEKVYSRTIRLSVPIVVVVPEEGDLMEEDEEALLVSAGIDSPGMLSRDNLGLAFSGDEFDYDLGDQGECPPYEATAGSGRRRSRR